MPWGEVLGPTESPGGGGAGTITSITSTGGTITITSPTGPATNLEVTTPFSDPLTTKGDIWGWSTTNARIPVGSNGRILMGDSAQTLGVGYSTTTADFNNQLTANAIQHKVINTGNPTGPYTSFYSNQSSTNVTDSTHFLNSAMCEFGANSTWTLNESLFNIATIFKSNSTISLAAGITSGETYGFHDITDWKGTGTSTYSELGGLKIETQLDNANGQWTLTTYKAIFIAPRSPSSTQIVVSNATTYGVHYNPASWTFSGTFFEWSIGADRGNAYFNGLTEFGGGHSTTTPAAVINITGVGTGAPTNLQATILDNHARTYSSASGVYNWLWTGTTTINASQGFNFTGILGLTGTYTFTSPATAGLSLNMMDFRPRVNGNTAIANVNNVYGWYFQPNINLTATGTMSAFGALRILPTFAAANTSITKYVGISSGMDTLTSTITTTVGLDIGVTDPLHGSTIWAMQVGNYQSYHQGNLGVGGTGAPTWNIHLTGGNAAANALGFNTSTTGPTAGSSSAQVSISMYSGSGGTNKYLLFSYNDGGTQRYKYLQLNGTGVTWATGTSLPT